MTRRSRPRGFTLIELMLVVCIIGLLSSVAVPVYQRSTLRARSAERSTILQSMNVGIEDAFVRGKIQPSPGLTGAPNPDPTSTGPEGTSKRHFDNAATGWSDINIVIQGDCYYTYRFTAIDASTASGDPAEYHTSAVGDLDGDTHTSTVGFDAVRLNGRWNATEYMNPPAPFGYIVF